MTFVRRLGLSINKVSRRSIGTLEASHVNSERPIYQRQMHKHKHHSLNSLKQCNLGLCKTYSTSNNRLRLEPLFQTAVTEVELNKAQIGHFIVLDSDKTLSVSHDRFCRPSHQQSRCI